MPIYCGKKATLEVLPPLVPRPDGLRVLPSDFLAGWSMGCGAAVEGGFS